MLEREIWFLLVCTLTLGGLAWGLRDTRRIIEAPFLYAVGMLLIVCPQFYVATYNYWRVPEQAFRVFSIMVVLSSLALYLGYSIGSSKVKQQSSLAIYQWVINADNLFKVGVFISMLGTIGWLQVRSLENIDLLLRGSLQGWPVYWYTLSSLTLSGITLIVIAYFQSKKQLYLICSILFSIIPMLAIVEYGRRSMTFNLPLIYLLPLLLFNPKLRISKWIIITALLASFLVVYAFPYWRGEFKEGRYFTAIREKPVTEIISDMFSEKNTKTLEVIDAMIVTGAHYQTNRYGLGIDRIYNSFIHRFVPGSLIGYDLKRSLFSNTGGVSQDWVSSVYGVSVARYTAKTSFSEFFAEFSFLGSILFFCIGYSFRRIHDLINYRFDGRAIIFLCFFITIPASLAYSGFLMTLVTRLPSLLIMLFVFKLCTFKRDLSQYYSYYYFSDFKNNIDNENIQS